MGFDSDHPAIRTTDAQSKSSTGQALERWGRRGRRGRADVTYYSKLANCTSTYCRLRSTEYGWGSFIPTIICYIIGRSSMKGTFLLYPVLVLRIAYSLLYYLTTLVLPCSTSIGSDSSTTTITCFALPCFYPPAAALPAFQMKYSAGFSFGWLPHSFITGVVHGPPIAHGSTSVSIIQLSNLDRLSPKLSTYVNLP